MTGGAASYPRKLYWRYKAGSQRAARDGDWKYLRIAGNEFLFDVVQDPRERANLKDRVRLGSLERHGAAGAGATSDLLPSGQFCGRPLRRGKPGARLAASRSADEAMMGRDAPHSSGGRRCLRPLSATPSR
jgi:hypothetical protein